MIAKLGQKDSLCFGISINRIKLVFFILLGACFLAYGASMGNGFLIDDNDLIENNAYVKDIRNLPMVFCSSYLNYYRPLSSLSLALDYNTYGLNSWGYHLSSILLHFMNCFLFFLLFQTLFKNFEFSFLSSLFFAVHPINSVTVNYISDRGNLLVSIFMLLSLLSFIYGLSKKLKWYYALTCLFFIFSLLSRENAVIFPAYLACVFFFTEKKKEFKEACFLFIPLFLSLLVFFKLRPDIFSLATNDNSIFLFKNLSEYLYIIIKYLMLTVAPFNISFYRAIPELTPRIAIFVWIIAITGTGLIYKYRKNKMVLFSMCWFLIGVAPLYKMMFSRQEIGLCMQDSWIYFSSMGLFGLIANLFLIVKNRVRIGIYFVFLFVCFLFLINQSWVNAALWKDTPTYCSYFLKSMPNSRLMLANMANYYFKQKDYKYALNYYQLYKNKVPRQFVKNEDKISVFSRMGMCYFELGDLENAQKYFNGAIAMGLQLDLSKHDSYVGMGKISLKKGNRQQAIDYFKKGIEDLVCSIKGEGNNARPLTLDKNVFVRSTRTAYKISIGLNCLKDWGVYLYKVDFLTEAKDCFEKVLLIGSEQTHNHDAHYNLGLIYTRLGHREKAISQHKKAAESGQFAIKANYCLSILYAKEGDKEKSFAAQSEVLSRDRDYYKRQ
ncbi:MAG: tetratricopeptide repeat protein [Candidatus Omnitrophica bacterium]|nr:tetratricopeptide repeat protein [Candidatus Omnitrophota bacterium]